MTRRSLRISSGTGAKATHKRAASGPVPRGETSSKTKKPKSTPTKSQYFQDALADEDDQKADPSDVDESLSSEGDGNTSDFGNDEEPTSDDDDIDNDDYESEEDVPQKNRKKAMPAKSSAPSFTATTKGAELWRPGVKTGLGPGTQVVIKKPTARPAGKIPYRDDAIHPNTMLFLADLKTNNDREWLKCK